MYMKLERPRVFHASLFHASQIDGLPEWEMEALKVTWNSVDIAEELVKKSGAVVKHDQRDRTFYSPVRDYIHMPPRSSFTSSENYYSVLLYELGHWTMHKNRLKRDVDPLDSEARAREELRLEISSFMTCTKLGLGHDLGNHASYVANWIEIFENNPNEVFRAAKDANDIAGIFSRWCRNRNSIPN